MVIVGVALIVFGLAFASNPITFARSVQWVRAQPIPPSPTRNQMRYYRAAGVAFATVGVMVLLLASLA